MYPEEQGILGQVKTLGPLNQPPQKEIHHAA